MVHVSAFTQNLESLCFELFLGANIRKQYAIK